MMATTERVIVDKHPYCRVCKQRLGINFARPWRRICWYCHAENTSRTLDNGAGMCMD